MLSFRDVLSCGTNTLASVPCMFSPLGKAAFEKRSAEHENLLDVLQAAGLAVLWLDNQAGCKERLRARAERVDRRPRRHAGAARLCDDGECLDDALLESASTSASPRCRTSAAARACVLVMHQMGSHGPAYYKRSAAGAEALPARVHEH